MHAGRVTTTHFNLSQTAQITGAITGGTGQYAGARGTFTSAEGKGGSLDTITLLD